MWLSCHAWRARRCWSSLATTRGASPASGTRRIRPRSITKGNRRNASRAARFATGGRAHAARPTTDAGTACWHTEAIHKANLTTDRVQAPALGSFGVDNVAGLVAGARAVDPHRKRLHVLALDDDHYGSREEVALARWNGVLGNDPDDALVAGAAVTLAPFEDPRSQPRPDQRVLHTHAWQRRRETSEEHQARLSVEAALPAARVESHLESVDPALRATLLVAAAPPSVGKSHAIATLRVPRRLTCTTSTPGR